MMSSDKYEYAKRLQYAFDNAVQAMNPPYIVGADGTGYRADMDVSFPPREGWVEKKTLKEKVMKWYSSFLGCWLDDGKDDEPDATPDYIANLEHRLKQLECEHGGYTYHRLKIDTFQWMPTYTIQYEKKCKDCFKTTEIDADEYYEHVTAEKYAEYEKVWEEWAEVCDVDN